MSLQNEREDGTSHCTEEPSGTRVRMKVSTLERSEGVGMLVVERHRPPYDRWNDSTIIELERESMRWEICGARGRRATGAAFDSTTTTMDQRKGPLDVLKGRQWLPGLWTTGPHAEFAGELCMWFLPSNGHMSCRTGGGGGGISTSTCHVAWCSRMFHCLLLLLCAATHSSASSWSNWHCCRGSGMRTREKRMGLGWEGWVRILRWGTGRGECLWIYSDVAECLKDNAIRAEDWVLLDWMGVKELDIIQVFSPLINVDKHFLDCWWVNAPGVHLGVDRAGFKEGAKWFNQVADEGGGGRGVA